MPLSSLLVEDQGFNHSFTSSSPSPDMEAALRHLISSCDTEPSVSPNFSNEPPSSPSLDMDSALQHLTSSCDSELSSIPISLEDPDVLMVDPFLDYLNEVLMEEQGEDDVPSMREDVKASYYAILRSLYDIIGESSLLYPTSSESNVIRENQVSSNFDVSLEQEKAGVLCPKQVLVQNCPSNAKGCPLETAHVTDCPVVRGLSDSRIGSGRNEQNQKLTSEIDVSSPDDNFSLESSILEISVEAGYADLYVGKPSHSDTSDRSTKLNRGKEKSSRAARKGSQSFENAGAEAGGFVDLRELLVNCAQAVAMGDVKKASEILQELYQVHGVSEKGSCLQHTAHYFCEALVARMGGHQYKGSMPSAVSLLRAARMWYELTPYKKLIHYFANQNILKVAKGASRLHILDYGISHGLQWPCLMNALADREGGPPLLVITGIECPKPGQNSMEQLQESGRRLAACARTFNVPFQFHAIVSDHWEDIDHTSLHLQKSEVLVINCMKRLRLHADESVDPTLTIPPRQKLLMSMHNLNPHLLLIAEMNAACNSPFFVSRFREALYYYSNMMDMLYTLWNDDVKSVVDARLCAPPILNIVACEGTERVDRPEMYRQWDARIKRAGFQLLPIPPVVLSRSKSYVQRCYHKDFIVHEDANGWMLLGWKGRTVLTISAWKPLL